MGGHGPRARAEGKKAACVSVAATDPLYILYTSGTTGQPKGVVRDNGGHMVALKWTMSNHYDIKPGEVFWAASDVGWVVGHSYIVYAPLLHGATSILFEGKPVGTPDAGTFWRVISQHNVAALFTAPTAFRAIKKEDPQGEFIGKYDLSRFRILFPGGRARRSRDHQVGGSQVESAGLRSLVADGDGWPICGNPRGSRRLAGEVRLTHGAMPGYDIRVLDATGQEVKTGETGTLAVKLPLPPSCLPTLWNNDERFRKSYLSDFNGYYTTSDAGYRDADGYVY